jgi:hypothetical protein
MRASTLESSPSRLSGLHGGFILMALLVTFAWSCRLVDDTGTGDPIDLGCEDPMPLLRYDGTPAGFDRCSDSVIHRTEAATCEGFSAPQTCDAEPGDCSSSDDCTDRPNGACLSSPTPEIGGVATCQCRYACETDDDCGDGKVCVCLGEAFPTCVPAGCTTDADCDGLCVLGLGTSYCGEDTRALRCLESTSGCRPGDPGTCPVVEDCFGGQSRQPCVPVEGGWACEEFNCATSCG